MYLSVWKTEIWKNKGVEVSGTLPSLADERAFSLPSPKQRAPMRICSHRRGVLSGWLQAQQSRRSFSWCKHQLTVCCWELLLTAPQGWSGLRHLDWLSHPSMALWSLRVNRSHTHLPVVPQPRSPHAGSSTPLTRKSVGEAGDEPPPPTPPTRVFQWHGQGSLLC